MIKSISVDYWLTLIRFMATLNSEIFNRNTMKKCTKYSLPKDTSDINVNTVLGVRSFPDAVYVENVKKLRMLSDT